MSPRRDVDGFVSTHITGCPYLDTLRRDDCSCGGVQRAKDAKHQQEAPELPAGYVVESRVGYFVQSRTTAGAWYLVSGATCSCKAGRGGLARCWHRSQVAAFVEMRNAENPRPRAADSGEQVVSRFVD